MTGYAIMRWVMTNIYIASGGMDISRMPDDRSPLNALQALDEQS